MRKVASKVNHHRYTIALSREQMCLIANVLEDVNRFMSGQMEMHNTCICLDNYYEISSKLDELKELVTPNLPHNASYGWNGGDCPNDYQRKFIAMSYGIYRSIYHKLAIDEEWHNVYSSATLHCPEAGIPITITKIEKDGNK